MKEEQRKEILEQIGKWKSNYQRSKKKRGLRIRTYLERNGYVLEINGDGEKEQKKRIETEIHDLVMKSLKDYSLKEERVKIETEGEKGQIYGVQLGHDDW